MKLNKQESMSIVRLIDAGQRLMKKDEDLFVFLFWARMTPQIFASYREHYVRVIKDGELFKIQALNNQDEVLEEFAMPDEGDEKEIMKCLILGLKTTIIWEQLLDEKMGA